MCWLLTTKKRAYDGFTVNVIDGRSQFERETQSIYAAPLCRHPHRIASHHRIEQQQLINCCSYMRTEVQQHSKCGKSGWFSNVKLKGPLRMKVAFWLVDGWLFIMCTSTTTRTATIIISSSVCSTRSSSYFFRNRCFRHSRPRSGRSIQLSLFGQMFAATHPQYDYVCVCARNVRPGQFTLRNENVCVCCVSISVCILYYTYFARNHSPFVYNTLWYLRFAF